MGSLYPLAQTLQAAGPPAAGGGGGSACPMVLLSQIKVTLTLAHGRGALDPARKMPQAGLILPPKVLVAGGPSPPAAVQLLGRVSSVPELRPPTRLQLGL